MLILTGLMSCFVNWTWMTSLTMLTSKQPGATSRVLLFMCTCPPDILCTEEEVYELLCSLDTSTSNGDDDISAKMLKATAQSITPVVTQIFNISLKLGEIPSEWKTARITPIPNSLVRNDPRNYRPVSLLSVLSKLLEKHVRNLLLNHLEESHPLSVQ